MSQSNDFVSRYVKLLGGITDAPEEFQVAAAYFILSTAVGRYWTFYSVVDAPCFVEKETIGGRLLNLWFILTGKSRISRKTTGVLNKVEEIVSELGVGIVPKAYSPEYLITTLNGMIEDNQVHATWINDECSGFFELIKAKGSYMQSADAVLSSLYDGKTYSRGTISRGREYVPNPYITVMLASTDYLPSLFEDSSFRQGFFNRFIFVPAEKKQRKPLRVSHLTDAEKEEVQFILRFVKALTNPDAHVTLSLNAEAKALYDEYEESVEDRIANENLDLKESYLGGIPNFVIRIACLNRISRMSLEELENFNRPILVVEKEDVAKAIQFAKVIWKWFEKVLDLRVTPTEEEVITLGKYETIVRRVFEEAGTNELKQNYLRKKTKIKTSKLEEVLKGIATWSVKGTVGRKAKVWKLKEDIM